MYTWSAPAPRVTATRRRRLRGLERVAGAESILDAIRITRAAASEAVADASASPAAERAAVTHLSAQARQTDDALVAIAAVHALARIPGADADRVLVEAMEFGNGSLREHVAWVAALRSPSGSMLESMIGILANGGLAGMHAQATLARWATSDPRLVAAALRAALLLDLGAPGRRHVVETLGLVPIHSVTVDLLAVALDRAEPGVVRAVAIAALGDRSVKLPSAIDRLAGGQGRVADAVRLAMSDVATLRPGYRPKGVIVAQIHLGAQLDPQLKRSGVGDTGGVATLLVKLGSALADTPGIDRVVTIGRGSPPSAWEKDPEQSDLDQDFASVALTEDEGTAFIDSWPARVAAERGIRRAFARHGQPDVLHLRMADVGTLAAANVATTLGIPTVFSLAPDPHAVIAAREASGALDRGNFAAEDAAAHLWFRVDLVERLTARADEVVLFPRARLADEIRNLVGVDLTAERDRFTVVPEGIDVAPLRRSVAARDAAAGESGVPAEAPMSMALTDLLTQVAELSPTRHGLPLVLSVGRLNELKGMARLVEAFAIDPALRARATLVIVGGNLDDPSAVEAEELDRIARTVAAARDVRDAIVLLGHRPNGEIADLLGAVRHGAGPLIGPGGAYACASRKEEFGLAIVEALAAGLPVVAPLVGGPATYVEDGKTGCLVDTTDPVSLARGVVGALELADRPGRADYVADAIARSYDISAMAHVLTAVYRRATATRVEQLAS